MNQQEDTKVCKSCGKEIPAQAKVCPYCNKKQSHKVRNTILIIVGVIVVLAAIGAMFGGRSNNSSSTNNAPATTTDNTQQQTQQDNSQQQQQPAQDNNGVLTVGRQATVNDVTVGLASAGLTPNLPLTGGLTQPAPSGKIFLLCGFIVKNDSSSDQAISTASFQGYCDNSSVEVSGYTYMINNGFTSDFSLGAGRETQGFLVFEVPENWQLMEIEFKPNMFLNDKLTFELRPDQCERHE